MSERTKGRRGFASMDPAKQRAIAVAGGKASGGNFANDPERARAAGRIGGKASSGQFVEGGQRAKEAGRAGGNAGSERRRREALNSHAAVVPSSTDFA